MKHTLQNYFNLTKFPLYKYSYLVFIPPLGVRGLLVALIFCLPLFFTNYNIFAQKKNEILLEDFKNYRPSFSYTFSPSNVEGTWILRNLPALDSTARPRLDVTQEINQIWDYIPPIVKIKEKMKRNLEGWRVQIYRGKSVEEAQKIRERSYDLFPNLTPYLEYRTPTYRVKSGDFLTENEAYPYWKRLKRIFPTALIVPDIVNVVVVDEDEDEKK